MKKAIVLALMGVSAVVCLAQSSRFPPINLYTGDPTGNACTGNIIQQSSTTGKLYTCQGGTMQAGSGSGTPGGSNLQLQFNNSGVFGGATGISTDSATKSIIYNASNAPSGPPVLDIRNPAFAGGAVMDGVTDIGPALQAAYDSIGSGEIILPCNPSCYWANPAGFNYSDSTKIITFRLQGILNTGTSFSVGNDITKSHIKINLIGKGGAANTNSFAAPGEHAQVIVNSAAHGALGTAVAVTMSDTVGANFGVSATFTPSTMTGLYVGTEISVSDTVTCTLATISRSGNNVSATTTGPCHIPPGVGICVAGVADSTYNGCHSGAGAGPFTVKASDYVANSFLWANSGTDGSSSGGTILGFNEDSPEVVPITAVTSTTATALFYRSHSATATWGVMGLWFPGLYSYVKDIAVSAPGVAMGGLGYESIWDGVSATSLGGCGSNPATNVYNYPFEQREGTWIHFNHVAFDGFCEPWSLHMQQNYNLGYGDAGPIYIKDSFLLRGVKMDHGGFGVWIDKSVCDQCSRAIVAFDPSHYWNGNSQVISIDHTFLQDNPDGFQTYYVYQIPGASSPGLSSSTGNATFGYINGYGVAGGVNPAYTGRVSGYFNKETSLEGEQAGMSPAIIPYNVTGFTNQDPGGWSSGGASTCNTTSTTEPAPDSSLTAGSVTQGVGTTDIVAQAQSGLNYTPVVGDTILFGGWEKANTGVNGGGIFVDNGSSAHFDLNYAQGNSGAYQKVTSGQWDSYEQQWHPVVGITTVVRADGSTNQNLRLGLTCNNTQTLSYWMPWWMVIPASANVPASEIQRWRDQLLHGAVPAGALAGTLTMNTTHKLYWGTDTNLYRSAAGVVQTDGTLKALTAVTSPQVNNTVYLTPSGDTSGATDQAAIVAALATGKDIRIPPGVYYFTGNIAVSAPPAITCAGPNVTFLYVNSTTNNMFNIQYGGSTSPVSSNVSHTGFIRNCFIGNSPSLTPTGGYAFKVGGIDSTHYLSGLHIDSNEVWSMCGGLDIEPFTLIDWFTNNTIFGRTTACASGHGIYLNDPQPAGDLHFDANELSGQGGDVLVHQSDVNEFTNLKTNGAGITFDNTADRVRFINPSLEGAGTGSTHPSCGFNFTGTAGNILDISVTGGAIDLMPHAFCANGTGTLNPSANTTRFSYNTIIYATSDGVTGNISSANLFSLNGAAPVNHCLVGNGTNYVDSAVCGTQSGLISASAPTFSPVAGSYTSTQSVAVSCSAGTPYYLTSPTVTAYSSPISVSANSTIQAVCTGLGYTPTLNSAAYYIGPPLQAQDLFAGTNGTTLASHTDIQGHSWTVWTPNTTGGQTMSLNGSGSAVGSGLSNYTISYYNSLTPSSADYTVSATFTVPNTATFINYVYARLSTGALTTYWLACSPTGCAIGKANAGVVTSPIQNYTLGWTNGASHTIGLGVSGTTLTAYIDGVAQSPTVTDSSISAAGKTGFAVSGASTVLGGNFTVQ